MKIASCRTQHHLFSKNNNFKALEIESDSIDCYLR